MLSCSFEWARLVEERRIVTVLFCDVTGSTALASQVDAEDWAEIISGAFPLLIDPVERNGGNVARLMGDAILAFFGAPVSREDDPERAILSGLDILEGIGRYRERVAHDYGLDFNVRVGINTGIAVTGEFGSHGASEYTAMGDAVNIAARMEQTAAPGTIQVTGETYRLALRHFEFEPLGPIEVKGKDEPVDAYRVLGRATHPRRRGTSDFAVPTVGRERELDLLRYKLTELRSGRGGMVALIGDAGLGKSRLLEELRREWAGLSARTPDSWVEDQLVSFEASVPYGLLRRRLASELQLEEGAAPTAIRTRLLKVLGSLGADERERAVKAVAQLFRSDLLETPNGKTAETDGGEDFRHELGVVAEQTLGSWIDRIEQGIYVIDDFHCIDPASADLLEQLLPNLRGLPLLVIVALRPERESPAWRLHEHLTTALGVYYLSLTLAPLDDRQSDTLIETLLPGARLPSEFRSMMLERIDGNPLFAEEIVRSLVEQGVIQADPLEDGPCWRVAPGADLATVEIPTTLHALIQERLDRLDAAAKQTLQIAAVIGRAFGVQELAETANQPGDLPLHLSALERSMLIHEVRQGEPGSYEFHHALTWEATYRSILRRNRRRLHRQVAEALERLHRGDVAEYAGILGFHFAEAGDRRAVSYAIDAGDQAFSLFAPAEAVEHYTRAVDVAGRFSASVPTLVYHRRGRSYLTLGDFERARRDFETSLELSREAADHRAEWRALTDMGDLWEGLDYQRSGEWRQLALTHAEEAGDDVMIADSLSRAGNWYSNVERIDEARDSLLRALAIFESHENRPSVAHVLDLLGTVEDVAGDLIRMLAYWREAAAIFEELGDRQRLASVLAGMSLSRGIQIFETVVGTTELASDEVIGLAERSLEIARSIGWRPGEIYALLSLSNVVGWEGHYDRAIEAAASGLAAAQEIRHLEWITLGHCTLAVAYMDVLQTERAIEALVQGLEFARQSGSDHFAHLASGALISAYIQAGMFEEAASLLDATDDGGPLKTIGRRRVRLAAAELALATGDAPTALQVVSDLYTTAANVSRPADVPRLALMRGEALAGMARFDEALDSLDEALLGAELRAGRPLIWRVRLIRGRVLARAGRHQESETELAHVSTITRQLAGEITDDETRTEFLSRAVQLIENAASPNELENPGS